MREGEFNTFDRLVRPSPGRFTCAYYTRRSDDARFAIQCVDSRPTKAVGPLSLEQTQRPAPDHFAPGSDAIDARAWNIAEGFAQVGGFWKRSQIVVPDPRRRR